MYASDAYIWKIYHTLFILLIVYNHIACYYFYFRNKNFELRGLSKCQQ